MHDTSDEKARTLDDPERVSDEGERGAYFVDLIKTFTSFDLTPSLDGERIFSMILRGVAALWTSLVKVYLIAARGISIDALMAISVQYIKCPRTQDVALFSVLYTI